MNYENKENNNKKIKTNIEILGFNRSKAGRELKAFPGFSDFKSKTKKILVDINLRSVIDYNSIGKS
jgi:hypothetical protein